MTDVDHAAWLEREDTSLVPVSASCSIGRAPGNHLILTDDKASRKHALIHRQGEHEYWLVDLGSSNGSYLDGRRVSQPVALRDGAIIRIGTSTLTFRQRATAQAANDQEFIGTVYDIRVAPCWLMLADIEGSTELSRQIPADQLPILTGRWFSSCRQVVEDHRGVVNKYLGDGFLAYWPSLPHAADALIEALGGLRRLQNAAPPRFRIVLHYGDVSLGGAASAGEESLSGPEVNFIFRMEKLAGSLSESKLISRAAHAELGNRLPAMPVGSHPLNGFEGTFEFFTF
jgi:adenylate cyclase